MFNSRPPHTEFLRRPVLFTVTLRIRLRHTVSPNRNSRRSGYFTCRGGLPANSLGVGCAPCFHFLNRYDAQKSVRNAKFFLRLALVRLHDGPRRVHVLPRSAPFTCFNARCIWIQGHRSPVNLITRTSRRSILAWDKWNSHRSKRPLSHSAWTYAPL